MMKGRETPQQGEPQNIDRSVIPQALKEKEREQGDVRVERYLEIAIARLRNGVRFHRDGDRLTTLAQNQTLLSSTLDQLVHIDAFLQDEFAKDNLSESEIQELVSRLVAEIPALTESMKHEVSENVQRWFVNYFYDSLPAPKGKRRQLYLTEPSGSRVRQGQREQLIQEWMWRAGELGPDHPNTYGFKNENLEFLRPTIEQLVDQVLSDYEQELAEGSDFK